MSARRIFAIVCAVFVLLLPANAGAQTDAPVYVYIPLVASGVDQGPEMVQFRSCGGTNNSIPLQFQEVRVGSLTALSENCTGGQTYPGPIANLNEAVVLGGYYMGELNWHSVPSLTLIEGQDAIFEMTFAKGDSSPSTYLNVRERDGGLSIDQGGVVITEPTTIEGWDISFHLDAVRPYIKLAYEDGRKIWVALEDNGSLWAEIRTPKIVTGEGRYAWGIWYEALQNEGQIPSELADYIFDRYPLNGN